MFFNQKSDSGEIARRLIAHTGLDENLGILKQKKHQSTVPPREHLKLVMALSTCNLVQTMKAEFMAGSFTPEKVEGIVKDYVLESFKKQELLPLGGKKESEALRLEVMKVAKELEVFWNEAEDPKGSGSGPRYYCVKEILRRLGGEQDNNLHDALFDLMERQHKHYLKFFRAHLEKPE